MKHDIVDNSINSLSLQEAIHRFNSTRNRDVKLRIQCKLQIIYGRHMATLTTVRKALRNPRLARTFGLEAMAGFERVQGEAHAIAQALGMRPVVQVN